MKYRAEDSPSTIHASWLTTPTLYATNDLRGLYNPTRFLVGLSPDQYQLLDGPARLVVAGEEHAEFFSAVATWLHETIHWWQHIGSTLGFLISLAEPSQTHTNRRHISDLVRLVGPTKSLKSLAIKGLKNQPKRVRDSLNTILNNWHDIDFNRRMMLNPAANVEKVFSHPFFETIGHSMRIALENALHLLGATFDNDFEYIPTFKDWQTGFEKLKKKRVSGHCRSAQTAISALGAVHIFEGQARFSELQYLYWAAGSVKPTMSDFKRLGFLGPIYEDAFDRFLEWAEIEIPANVTSPTVSLFLLICDISINPCDGYPFQLLDFESFVISTEPGMRFYLFCKFIARNPSLKRSVAKCSREEYLELSTVLCRHLACRTPVEMAERICLWSEKSESLRNLLLEEKSYDFGPANFPIRFLFSKHIRFMEDRLRFPQFFCWPGMHLFQRSVDQVDLAKAQLLFERHKPPFTSAIGGEVRPTLRQDVDERLVYSVASDFYGWNIIYNLVSQWTVSDGPFDLDFSWIGSNFSAAYTQDFAEPHFKQMFATSLGGIKF